MKVSLIIKSFLAGVLGLSLSSCDLLGPRVNLTVKTNSTAYERLVTSDIRLTIFNGGSSSVYYNCGGAIALEQWKGGKLDFTWPPAEQQCGRVNELKPGETTTRITGMAPDQLLKHRIPDLGPATTFRFRVTAYSDRDLHDEVDRSEQRSNQFRVSEIGL